MFDTWFAQPGFLWLLGATPVAATFLLYAWLKRRRARALLGDSVLARTWILIRPRVRRWSAVSVILAVALLALACARPQWGRDPTPQQRVGRDVVLVLDVSRSMLAEQPSRRERAIRAVASLADTFERDGGNRIALILFAERPILWFPLTHDCDHLRHALRQVEANDYPSLSSGEGASGTRFGAALTLAVASGESERSRRPIVVLLSDGDDPAPDEEWLEGVNAAKAKHVKIHAVGFGDPLQAHTIPAGKDQLTYEGTPVRTKLNEDRLKEIAERTGGTYLPAREQAFDLGAFLQYLLDADAWREEEAEETTLPVYQQRYAWFLLPALLLLALTIVPRDGPSAASRLAEQPRRRMTGSRRASKAPALIACLLALTLISAEPAPDAAAPRVDELIRQGNDAFAERDYEAAIQHYEQAEPLARDPGLVSLNKAAAFYRLEKYREAVECYQRCLDDDQAPPARRGRAYFDMGDTLMRLADSSDPNLLFQAASAYRSCLRQPGLSAELRADARHNLELAQVLWLRARAKQPQDSTKEKESPMTKNGQDTTGKDDEPENGDGKWIPVDPGKDSRSRTDADLPKHQQKSSQASRGAVQVLPDRDQVDPISAENTLATLEHHARRIADLRRRFRHPAAPAAVSSKDW